MTSLKSYIPILGFSRSLLSSPSVIQFLGLPNCRITYCSDAGYATQWSCCPSSTRDLSTASYISSSTRRRIRFVKETVDITQEEIQYVQNVIKTICLLEGRLYCIKHTMMLTKVDAKVYNSAAQTASKTRCYIPEATPKEFNNLKIKRDIDVNAISFVLSTLHA